MSEKSFSRLIRIIFILPCALFIPVTQAQENLKISKLQIMEAPPTVRNHAGYLHIENLTDSILQLESAKSPLFDRIEFHYSDITDGVAMMRRQDKVNIPARDSVTFKPGGYHLMLINARQKIQEGDRVPLTFMFSDGTRLEMLADVRQIQNSIYLH